MGIFHHESTEEKAYKQVLAAEPHKTHITEDELALAAAYAATKAFEHRVEHSEFTISSPATRPELEKMKAALSVSIGAFVDDILKNKGISGLNITKVKHQGLVKAEAKVQNHFWNPNTAPDYVPFSQNVGSVQAPSEDA